MLLAGSIAWLVNKPLQKYIQESQKASCERQSFLLETLTGLETVKAETAESQYQYRWERLNRHLASLALKIRKLQFVSSQSATFILQTGTILIVAGGVYLIGAGELSMGGLIATMMISGRCTAPVVQSIGLLNQYQRARQAMDHTDTILSLPQERPHNRQFLKPGELKGSITLNHVSFAYPNAHPLLKDLNVAIQPGEKIAILGRMGAGKSTFLQLLMGLWEQTAGHVSFDEIDSRQIDPATLRHFIGYVPQRVTLFSGSIRDNLLLGRQGFSDDELIAAIQKSGLGEIISAHPEGLDYQVGESGRNLSGGQIQSIGVARALLGKPNILLLDEPTSSMDSQSELLIKKLLTEMSDTTVILVTHKMSMVEAMDKVMVLEQGAIAGIRAAHELGASVKASRKTETKKVVEVVA
jgi:ATP-binding cassette subfamily C protein LapB